MRRIYICICFISIFFFGVTPTNATTINDTPTNTTLHHWNFYNDAFVVEDRDTIAHEQVTIPHRWGNFFW
ncbi:hypothetical protein [Caryophanon tenue]|uniref:Secreted protein n=1 Tax=Caryophanon tenue TaxID=33978 RepID=A0A1C0Y6S2_9BACL|nr:hypothetical protein [Caryophanon tenue]OCS82835.1 hypothetical protein A6M13_05400 [Caryophanon tenue]